MSRKLRFFKDQISKAGLMSSSRTVLQPDIDLEDLEVSFYFSFFFLRYDYCLRVRIQVTCCQVINNNTQRLPVCLRILTLKSDNIVFCWLSFCQIQLAEHEHELIEMNSNSDKLRQSYNELLEFKIVLQKVYFLLSIFQPG